MDLERAVTALGALAQETRLQIFRALVRCGPEGLAAGAIATALSVAPPTLSFHLQQLNHAGLIVKRRVGRSLVYSINIKGMNAFMGYLTEDCCGGRPELCQPTRGSCDRAPDSDARASPRRRALKPR